eukprot:TRINITY_DN139_c0_g1_i1.p1 TRINITY_DN139_c0_g1~~TRINITY_DN139_c0_g1_i1.p1  ORF type:complete len:309 (-),score=40.22 TRINITY_DN139_c0_g1_i1:154-1023(-)
MASEFCLLSFVLAAFFLFFALGTTPEVCRGEYVHCYFDTDDCFGTHFIRNEAGCRQKGLSFRCASNSTCFFSSNGAPSLSKHVGPAPRSNNIKYLIPDPTLFKTETCFEKKSEFFQLLKRLSDTDFGLLSFSYLEFPAGDGSNFKNTLWLDKGLGWKGICIESNPNLFQKLYASDRSCFRPNVGVSRQAGFTTLPLQDIMRNSGFSQMDLLNLDCQTLELDLVSESEINRFKFILLNENCSETKKIETFSHIIRRNDFWKVKSGCEHQSFFLKSHFGKYFNSSQIIHGN